jgi:glycosyltransferase involved in cell wall biosynthesis
MTQASNTRVLYIVYWGAGEPLGQSLVVPAVKKLAGLGAELTLVTFEKPSDLARSDYMAAIGADLARAGVRWFPLRYHKSPKIPATLFDFAQGTARSIALRLGRRFDIVHARTFVGGLMGMALAPLLRAGFIYHNEGFYPDEQVDGGVWRCNSAPHRVARFLERKMYGRADGIIAMSNRGRRQIEQLPEVERRSTPVIVVPSCVDLDLFDGDSQTSANDGLRLVYSGSVGGRYILDRVGRFVAVASQKADQVRLTVLTRAERGLVSRMLAEGELPDSMWSMESVPYRSMPDRLASAQAGLFFLARGISEHGCSPTKVGEYWAMGLPVITTPNVSDTDEIIERERVGVIVRGHSDSDYERAIDELLVLLQDPDLGRRCRQAAEGHYALDPACERQYALYSQLSGGR